MNKRKSDNGIVNSLKYLLLDSYVNLEFNIIISISIIVMNNYLNTKVFFQILLLCVSRVHIIIIIKLIFGNLCNPLPDDFLYG